MINIFNTQQLLLKLRRTVILNYEEIESHPEKASNIGLFINKYNWEGTNYQSKIDDWKTFEKNNPTITYNILYYKEK